MPSFKMEVQSFAGPDIRFRVRWKAPKLTDRQLEKGLQDWAARITHGGLRKKKVGFSIGRGPRACPFPTPSVAVSPLLA